jgi:hypothetical protein
MDAGGIGPPPSRCKREGLPLAYASNVKKKKVLGLKRFLLINNYQIKGLKIKNKVQHHDDVIYGNVFLKLENKRRLQKGLILQ